MLMKKLAIGLVMMSAGASTLGFAGEQQFDAEDKDIPNVLIVKVPDGASQMDAAQVIALRLDNIPYDNEMIDVTRFDGMCDAELASAEAVDINALEYTDAGVPETVREVFEAAERETDNKRLNWRFYAGNRGLGFGIYGYGHQRGYGYGHYPHYQSRWGVHRGLNHYRYYPSFYSRHYNGYRNYYYYR